MQIQRRFYLQQLIDGKQNELHLIKQYVILVAVGHFAFHMPVKREWLTQILTFNIIKGNLNDVTFGNTAF